MSFRGHETVDHAADMGIRGWGRTPAEAFEEVAAAMFELMVNAAGLAPSKKIRISRGGSDLVELLLEYLNGLLSEADVAGIVPFIVSVGVLEEREKKWIIEATAEGAPAAAAQGRLLVEVKAATYYGASVREGERGAWIAQCVVDL
jgi:SHS2 domain-containing protein